MSDAQLLYQQLVGHAGADFALRIVQVKYPAFKPGPLRPLIQPRSVPHNEPGDATVLASDAAVNRGFAASSAALLGALIREHPGIVARLRARKPAA